MAGKKKDMEELPIVPENSKIKAMSLITAARATIVRCMMREAQYCTLSGSFL